MSASRKLADGSWNLSSAAAGSTHGACRMRLPASVALTNHDKSEQCSRSPNHGHRDTGIREDGYELQRGTIRAVANPTVRGVASPSRVRMSSASSYVNRRLLTGKAQASAPAHTQVRLYFSTNSVQIAPSPIYGLGAIRSNTEIHAPVAPDVGESGVAKTWLVRASWIQGERTSLSLETLEASAGKSNSTGTVTMIGVNPAQGGTNHEDGILLSVGEGLRFDWNSRQGFGAK